MTIGPAPMIRIEEISLRLGIEARVHTQKKGALSHVLRSRAGFRFARDRSMACRGTPARGRCLDQNRKAGKGEPRPQEMPMKPKRPHAVVPRAAPHFPG